MNRSFTHKLRLTVFAFLPLIVVGLGFQNCGKAGSIPQAGAGGEVQKISTSEFRDLIIPDTANNRKLDLNVDSGVVQSSDGDRFCLNNSDLQELQNLLKSSSVCEPVQPTDENLVCTMIYKFPYAHLRSSSLELALGEARNGCDRGLDLCGEAGAQLRSIVAKLVSSVDGMQCN